MTTDLKIITSGKQLAVSLIGPILSLVVVAMAIVGQDSAVLVFGLLLFVANLLAARWFILHQSIQVDKSSLSVQYIPKWSVPKATRKSILINDIAAVIIGSSRYLKEHSDKSQNIAASITKEFPLLILIPNMSLVQISSKKPNVPDILFSARPFSKNGFRKLIAILRICDIPVATDPSLGF